MLITKEDCDYINYSEEIGAIKECRKRESCTGCPFSPDNTFSGCPSYNLFRQLQDILEDRDYEFYSEFMLYEEVDF